MRINVFVNFSLITSGKHLQNHMLSLKLQWISLMNFNIFYNGMKTRINLFYFSDEP